MESSERIAVELPDGLVEELRASVTAGEHASVDQAVEDAVERWTADRVIARIGVEKLRRHWDEGLASGEFRPLDLADVIRRVEERARELRDERSIGG